MFLLATGCEMCQRKAKIISNSVGFKLYSPYVEASCSVEVKTQQGETLAYNPTHLIHVRKLPSLGFRPNMVGVAVF
jgi:hypothetical protein